LPKQPKNEPMIDWFTIGAQALNFLILVWLLKHFLYKPILNAIDAREKRVAKELADADSKKAESQQERDEFQRKNEEFDQQRAALWSKATEEAQIERRRLVDEARKAADVLTTKRQEALIDDAQKLHQSLMRRTQQEVFAITRKTLADLASTSLEKSAGEVFTERVRGMETSAKAGLALALRNASEPALIRSAFDLPTGQREAIQRAVNETFSADVPLRYETKPELIGGIELTSNGQKVAWSIADYLTELEKSVSELLEEKDQQKLPIEVKGQPNP